jgi:hypothetical protein
LRARLFSARGSQKWGARLPAFGAPDAICDALHGQERTRTTFWVRSWRFLVRATSA